MTTVVTGVPVCLICDGNCASSRNSVQIFQKESQTCTEKPLHMVMSQVLEKEIAEEEIHSTVICKKCFKLFDQVDELDQQITHLKSELITNHNNSLLKYHTGEIIIEQLQEEKPKCESNKENEVPKKILDIPSSDDDNSQVQVPKTQLQTFTDIEMELEKMHTIDDDSVVIQDSGAVDHSSESEYEPPVDVQITEVQVKSEIFDTVSEKPNILRRRPVAKKLKEEEEWTGQEIITATKAAHEGMTYTCLLCSSDNVVLRDAKATMQHVKEMHDVRLYICDVCGLDFRKRNELSAHLDDHVATEEGDFQCEVCNRIFSNLRLFRIHKRMHYPQNKAWCCDTCGKKYSSKNLLDEHINTHTGVRPYVCPLCGKDFASKYTYRAHEKTHEVRPRPFRCTQCPKSFLSQQNLTQHERTHSGVKEYACHLCGKQFGSAHNLEVHSIVHTGHKPFACSLCGKAFARKAEIRDHERTHTGERPYQCEFCGATFSQRSNLQSHKRATHYDDKRYKCTSCGKGFKRRRLLDYHVKAAHTGERPFKCDVCEATFVYPEHFKKHRRIHTGEKPFLCEVCGKAFNSRDNRNAHRFVHSDKKPYECLVCGAGFMRKPLLYQHMQSQNHLNDTIVVNQPRLTTNDDQIVTVNAAGEMEIVDHVLVEDATVAESQELGEEQADAIEHIIIDGDQIRFTEDDAMEEEPTYEEVQTGAIVDAETQVIDTPSGPIQLVKVRIPNEDGTEEEAWIKIVPENNNCARATARVFNEMHPDKFIGHQYVLKLMQKFMETGSVANKKHQPEGRIINEPVEIAVLGHVAMDNNQSLNKLSRASGVSTSSIWRILKKHKFHPYKMKLLQELKEDDNDRRLQLCEVMSNNNNNNNLFITEELQT